MVIKMRYIKKVILENFQSHKYTVLDLDPELNVIVGPSDTGKSAIIRGIKWALYNEPSGDYFIREGERECSVTIEFNDNLKVKRYRSRSKNAYILYTKDGQEIKYEGFGTSVPEEIIEQTGISKIYLDSDESSSVNFGEQLEGAFLLSEKTGVRASAIGRLVGVNLIDDALRETLRDSRNLQNNKKILESNISDLENELKGYEYLEELSDRISKIEEVKNNIVLISERKDNLINLLVQFNKLKSEIKDTNDKLNSLKNLEELEHKVKSINDKYRIYSYLYNQSYRLNRIIHGIKEDMIIIKELQYLDKGINIYNKLEYLSKRNVRLKEINDLKSKLTIESKENKKLLEKLKGIDKIYNSSQYIKDSLSVLLKLKSMSEKYYLTKESIKKGISYLYKLEEVELIEDLYSKILSRKEKVEKLLNLYSKYKANVNEKQKEIDLLRNISIKINDEKKKYEDLLSKLEICPFCLSTIDNDKIKHIINHID